MLLLLPLRPDLAHPLLLPTQHLASLPQTACANSLRKHTTGCAPAAATAMADSQVACPPQSNVRPAADEPQHQIGAELQPARPPPPGARLGLGPGLLAHPAAAVCFACLLVEHLAC
jgi:hypothetical protein